MATDGFRSEFELEERSVWLNTAHQGRLPRRAARALAEAVRWKLHPELLATPERFTEVPTRLRRALARVLGAREDEIVLANSASYGLHLVANGLDLGPGDEVVVAANDFPSDILPWLLLRDRGVTVHMIEPRDEVLTPDEVAAALTPRTRVVCLTWVHSFSGRVVDLDGVGRACRSAGAWFVVNGSQAVGAMPVDVRGLPVDALVSAGFKWMCGPYGTGVCWLRPELFDALRPAKLYWLSALTTDDLAAPWRRPRSTSGRSRPRAPAGWMSSARRTSSTTSRSVLRWSCCWSWGSARWRPTSTASWSACSPGSTARGSGWCRGRTSARRWSWWSRWRRRPGRCSSG
jgi:selenocysteine lyase/cysteine desulfurase